MTQYGTHFDSQKHLYKRSANLMKAHGVLSILFGISGVFLGILFIYVMTIGSFAYIAQSHDNASVEVILGLLACIFFVLPHLYLIVSGVYLVRESSPPVTKVFIILNLIVGIFMNIVVAAFAVANIIQSHDYERGHKATS